MIIVPQKKALILKLRDPSKVVSVIPKSKVVNYKGQQLIAVPHRRDEVKFLRNIGLDAPSPAEYYYQWSGMRDPFHTQRKTVGFLTLYSRAYCLNGMGTGKTLSALWAADYLRKQKLIKKILVVAPLSTLERTWADEVWQHFPHLEAVVLHGSRDRRIKLLQSDADIYIVNHHGLEILESELAKRADIDLIIIDELAVYRNAHTKMWKAANRICNQQHPRSVWGLTGTPIPNSPTDAFGQIRLVTPNQVPKYFSRFRDMLMRQVNQFIWVPRHDAVDQVHSLMQPSIRFSLDECTDLPPQVVVQRQAELSPEQKRAYKDMFDKLKAEHEGGEIMAVNEAVKAGKLLQICCGVVYDVNGADVVLPMPNRLAIVDELIEESEGKVIIFVPFTGALNAVAEHVSKTLSVTPEHKSQLSAARMKGERVINETTAVVDGSVPKNKRDQIFGDFQKAQYPRVLVAQPATMSHGLTLTAGTTIIWFAPTHSNETFEQANARVRRPGQTRSTVIACISGSAIEDKCYTRLKNRQSTQGVLLDMFKST